jgi:hypothetical protein
MQTQENLGYKVTIYKKTKQYQFEYPGLGKSEVFLILKSDFSKKEIEKAIFEDLDQARFAELEAQFDRDFDNY